MARERYLIHAGEETINLPDGQLPPQTPKSKRQNFWYYHKRHLFVGAIALVVVGFFAVDMIRRVEPDYDIGILSSSYVSPDAAEAIGEAISHCGQDLNGDGKTVAQVNTYTMFPPLEDPGSGAEGSAVSEAIAVPMDPNMQAAGMMKFTADLQMNQSVIFIMDEASFKTYAEQEVFDPDDPGVPMEDVALLAPFAKQDFTGLKGMSLRLRLEPDKANDKTKAYYAACKAFYEALLVAEPAPAASSTPTN